MLTAAEKMELEALEKKTDITSEEQARLDALNAKADADETMYSEAYVKQLRQEAAKYRTKMREHEEALVKFTDVDVEEYTKMKEEQKKSDTKKLEEKGEFEKLRMQIVEENNKELALKDSKNNELAELNKSLKSEIQRVILCNEISAAASVAKAINPKLVEMVVLGNTKVEETEDGRKIVKVLDAEGNTRIDIKTGSPLSIIQLLDEMKQTEEYAHLFAGAKTGGGSGTINFHGTSVQNPWKKESFNLTLQGQIVRDNPELAVRLKAEAGR